VTALPRHVLRRWEVVLDDGDIQTVDTRNATLLSLTDGGCSGLVSVDSCEVGTLNFLNFRGDAR